jgi:hypothetical protein
MTIFTFQGQDIQMENSAKVFLEKYLKRIELYAKKHQISADMIDDLQQSIGEKLFDLEQPITQKKLIPLINSLGEPEAIFEEENISILPEEQKKYCLFIRFLRAIGKIIIACCKGIITAFRLFFKYLSIGLRLSFKYLGTGLGYFFKYLGIGLGYFFKYLGIGLWKLFSIGSRVLGILILFCIIWGLVVALGIWFGDFTLLNQSFKLLLSDLIMRGLIGILLCCCFWMVALASSFSTTPLKNWYLHLLVIVLFLGSCIAGGIATLTPLMQIRPFTHTIELDTVSLPSDQPLQLFLPYRIEAGIQDWKLERSISTTTGEEMKIAIKSRFWATSADAAQHISSAIVQPQLINISDTEYELVRPSNGQIFKQVVPFNAIELEVHVVLPEGSEVVRK